MYSSALLAVHLCLSKLYPVAVSVIAAWHKSSETTLKPHLGKTKEEMCVLTNEFYE